MRGDHDVRLPEPFLEAPVRVPDEALALAAVQLHRGLPDVHALGLHQRVRRALRLRAPLRARVRLPSRALPDDLLGLVAHGHHDRFLQVRPRDEHAAAEEVRERRRAGGIVGGIGIGQQARVAPAADAQNQRFFLARRPEDVDPRVLELAPSLEARHRREPGRAVDAELDAREQAAAPAEARAVRRELARRHALERLGFAGKQAREHLRERRRRVARAGGRVLKHDQGTGLVALNLRGAQLVPRNAGDALLQERLVEEWEQDDALPVVSLALEVHLEFAREEGRQRRVRRVHEPTKRLGEQRGALRRLHGEELLERAEGPAVVERDGQVPQPLR